MKTFLYVIGPKDDHIQKIGYSKDPEKRLKQLQTGASRKLYIHHLEECNSNDVRKIEKSIHNTLRHLKSSGEWFTLTPEEAVLELRHAMILYG